MAAGLTLVTAACLGDPDVLPELAGCRLQLAEAVVGQAVAAADRRGGVARGALGTLTPLLDTASPPGANHAAARRWARDRERERER